MSEVKWVKIVTDIFDDEKILLIESLPDADSIIVIWFKLLCLAGKQNNSGVFMLNDKIPYTDEMFATIFRRKPATVRAALQTFEQFGMIEVVNNTVTIPNWEKHQQLDALERSRAATRNRVACFRLKQKALLASNSAAENGCNVTGCVTVTPGNADRIDKNKNNNIRSNDAAVLESFAQFWTSYPRKVSKQSALKAWSKLKPKDDLLKSILADVERRVAGEWHGREMQYIPHPATYLNQRRWEDEVADKVDDEDKPTIQELLAKRMAENGGSCLVEGFDYPFGEEPPC